MAFQLKNSLTFVSSRLANHLQEAFNRELAVLDISWSQWLVVHCLASGQASTPAEIARRLCISRPVVTRLLDRLEAKGLVERLNDREDRRSVSVRISEPGRLLIEYMDAAAVRHETSALEQFGVESLRMLQRATQKLDSIPDS